MPKQKRNATSPPRLEVPAVAEEMQDHSIAQAGMYMDGLTLVKTILEA